MTTERIDIDIDIDIDEELLEALKLQPVDKKLKRYKSNWLQHVTRMNKNNFQKWGWIIDQMKITWKTSKETTRWGWNMSIKA